MQVTFDSFSSQVEQKTLEVETYFPPAKHLLVQQELPIGLHVIPKEEVNIDLKKKKKKQTNDW